MTYILFGFAGEERPRRWEPRGVCAVLPAEWGGQSLVIPRTRAHALARQCTRACMGPGMRVCVCVRRDVFIVGSWKVSDRPTRVSLREMRI